MLVKKTSESTIAINKNIETIKLLANDINRYKKHYKFLRIGLVQVAVKPLYILGLDVPIYLLLRDNSNLANGPVYFNCYPNYSIDINDQNVIDTFILNVKTKNMNSKANSREIATTYRVYYRLMKTTLAPKAKKVSNKGVTMLMEANHNHNNTFVPKMIQWDDILTKDDWHFDSIMELEIEEEIQSLTKLAFRDQWFNDMKRLKCNIEFFKWFEYTGKLDDKNESLNMLVNKWYTTKNKVVESTVPPLEEITLPIEGKVITASPFKMDIIDTKGDPTNKDINKIFQQNNYTNKLVYVVSNQILRADSKLDIKDKPSSSYKDKNKNLETTAKSLR
ncbi:hypothetical protein H5410_036272, partial [Solanum commersonii]